MKNAKLTLLSIPLVAEASPKWLTVTIFLKCQGMKDGDR